LFQAEVHDCPLALADERKRSVVPQERRPAQAPWQRAVWQAAESQAVRKEQRGGRVSWQVAKLVRRAQGTS